MPLNRVVITGLGAVTPLGNTVSEFWSNAIKGKSGANPITRFDAQRFKTQFACEVKHFEPEKYLTRNEIKRTDLFTRYGLYAASEAFEESGLDINRLDPNDIGVIWGSGQGGMSTFEEEVSTYVRNDENPRFNPFFVPKMISNITGGMIAMKYGLMGINYTTVSACATSNSAIMNAYNYIRYGKAKAFITGGSEAPVSEASMGGFNALKALSTNNSNPGGASRPFDIDRDGFVMGEGSCALVLEDYEHAKKRGATIYAEVVGAAMTADAYHLTATHPEGVGALRAMTLACEEAAITPADIDYLNMHATSTPVGDISELKAVERFLGQHAQNTSISATKSMTGHMLGAAGAAEAILSILALRHGIIPPTINTTKIDPALPQQLDIVIGEARQRNLHYAMSNTFGFGGHNAISLFKKM